MLNKNKHVCYISDTYLLLKLLLMYFHKIYLGNILSFFPTLTRSSFSTSLPTSLSKNKNPKNKNKNQNRKAKININKKY